MSVALSEAPRSPDKQRCLHDMSVVVQPSSPSAPARETAKTQVHSGRDGREGGDDTKTNHGRQDSDPVCSHGDTSGMVNFHGNRNESRAKECVEAGPRQQARGGARYLRQQWAKHTQPQVCVRESSEEEKLMCGVNVWGDGGEVGVRGGGGDGGEMGVRGDRRTVGVRGELKLRGDGWRDDQLPHSQPDTANGRLPSHHHPSSSPDTTTTSPLSLCGCGRQARQLLKSQSVGSISSESLTISSLWDAPSYDTVPDFLSSLGFDDFDSRELIPDRFIPPELGFVRPSLMRQSTLGSVGLDDASPPSDGLLLGATADSVPQEVTIAVDQPDTDLDPPLPPQTLALYLPSNSQLPWQPASLETVVEETGSELLSPRPSSRHSARLSPHLNSPLLSIDHTPTLEAPAGLEGDVSAGLLGAGLAQRLRQQVMAKEDLRQRQMSLGGDSDTSSLYFSVGSHFEEGDESSSGVKEGGKCDNREGGGATEEAETGGKRRRRGNYAPPPQLLMWLEKSESCDTEDQPWPFSESSSPGHSPAHHTISDNPLPSITLNGNSNNNCQQLTLCTQHTQPVDCPLQNGHMGGVNEVKDRVCTEWSTSSFISSSHDHTPQSWSPHERL